MCVNWQQNSTGGCTTTYSSRSYLPSIEGSTYVYSPGFVGESRYANNAACTWIISRSDECSSLEFILVRKDLAHNEQNARNCENNDHLDLDNGQRLYCDRQERDNCPINNCPSVSYISSETLCLRAHSVYKQYNDCLYWYYKQYNVWYYCIVLVPRSAKQELFIL